MNQRKRKHQAFWLIVGAGVFLSGIGFGSETEWPEYAVGLSVLGALILLTVVLTSGRVGGLFRPKSNPSASEHPANPAEELAKWHKLKEDGVIADEEFEQKKKQLMG